MTDLPPRRSDGRFKADHSTRNRAGVAIGAALLAGVAAGAGLLWSRLRKSEDGHAADDLVRDDRPGAEERAPAAFRPDVHATPTAAERDGLAPATLPVQPIGVATDIEVAPTRP